MKLMELEQAVVIADSLCNRRGREGECRNKKGPRARNAIYGIMEEDVCIFFWTDRKPEVEKCPLIMALIDRLPNSGR